MTLARGGDGKWRFSRGMERTACIRSRQPVGWPSEEGITWQWVDKAGVWHDDRETECVAETAEEACFRLSDGLTRMEFISAAHKLGSKKAATVLGMFYMDKSPTAALRYFEQAAAGSDGDAEAMYLIYSMMKKGGFVRGGGGV